MTDEDIDRLVEDLQHGSTGSGRTLYDKAANALLALKARAEAAEQERDALRERIQGYAKWILANEQY